MDIGKLDCTHPFGKLQYRYNRGVGDIEIVISCARCDADGVRIEKPSTDQIEKLGTTTMLSGIKEVEKMSDTSLARILWLDSVVSEIPDNHLDSIFSFLKVATRRKLQLDSLKSMMKVVLSVDVDSDFMVPVKSEDADSPKSVKDILVGILTDPSVIVPSDSAASFVSVSPKDFLIITVTLINSVYGDVAEDEKGEGYFVARLIAAMEKKNGGKKKHSVETGMFIDSLGDFPDESLMYKEARE